MPAHSLTHPLTFAITRRLTDPGAGGGVTEVDLFVIVGQSNAEGRGTSASSPDATAAGLYYDGANFSALADPVGGASTGSMWPAFANEWFTQAGRLSCFIESATGGTALIPDTAGSNWSPSGSLRAAAVTAANDAIAAINASPSYELGSVYFAWCQGESEAQTINGTTITGALYESALETLADYFKAQVPEMTAMGVIRTGNRTPRTADADWLAIRAAQESACTDNANLRMLYRGAASFPTAGMNLHTDNLHWGQTGLNLAGKCAARELAKVSETAIPAAPSYLAHQSFADAATDSATSQTRSHSTHANTKMMIVLASGQRTGNNNSMSIGSCTFNGVAMTLIAGATASGTASRSVSGIFAITETQYGSALGGVTANIVHTPSLTTNVTQLAVIDLDAEGLVDNFTTGLLDGGATGTSIAASLSTGAPTIVLGVAASTATSASAVPAALTGMTEIYDGGASTGTVSGQMCAGYRTLGEVALQDVGVSFGATVTAGAYVVASLRGKIDGE